MINMDVMKCLINMIFLTIVIIDTIVCIFDKPISYYTDWEPKQRNVYNTMCIIQVITVCTLLIIFIYNVLTYFKNYVIY